ncbi:hypothetical protein ACDY97_33305 [Rhizobium mongolense]|uniref:hypothetical protein n=1 Tax=Rhizobium mongolense TaxID=57676 RepID=UPI00355757F0
MCSYVACEIIRQQPDRVTALILIATSARGDSDVQAKRKAALNLQEETSPGGWMRRPLRHPFIPTMQTSRGNLADAPIAQVCTALSRKAAHFGLGISSVLRR